MRSLPTSKWLRRHTQTIQKHWKSRLIRRQKSVWVNTRWGEKTRTDSEGKVAKAWEHDPPAKEKLVPFGVLILVTGALTLIFGNHETSDFWGDCLRPWWTSVKEKFPNVRRLTIYLDNGPKNSGKRTQFLKRMIEFADWSGLEIHLVYDPPYHSKFNRIERCWSSLQQKWNGVLLTCWEIVKAWAERMTWKGRHSTSLAAMFWRLLPDRLQMSLRIQCFSLFDVPSNARNQRGK